MASLALVFDILARDRASSVFARVGGAAEGAGKQAGLLGKAMAGAVVTGIGASINKAMDFDKTMRTVSATLGTSGPVQKELTALAMKMGKDTVFSAGEASEAMLELAKNGMTAAQIQGGALASTMTLAAAGSLDMGAAATYVGNALNTFGLKASDANAVAAALAGGANASSASVESLGMALSQVGPGAKQAGLSIQETTAILAGFDNAGIKGSDAGTSLKTMLTRLIPATDKASSTMEALGLKFTDAKGMILPMADVAQQLQDKLKGLSDEERTAAFNTLFGSDATRAATIMMNLGRAGVEKYTKATSDQAAAQRMAKTSMEGAAGAWEGFKGSIETIAISLGVKLLPLFTNVINGANDIAGVILDKMGPALDGVIGVLGRVPEALKAGFSGDTESFDGFLGFVARVADAFGSLVEEWKTGTGTGGQLKGVFDNLARVGASVGEVFVQIKDRVVDFVTQWQNGTGVGGEFRAELEQVGVMVKNVSQWLADNKTVVQSLVVALLAGVAAFKVISAAVKAYTALQAILNVVMAANPIGIVIVAIAALAAGLIYAYKTSDKFRSYVDTAFSMVKIGALTLAGVAIGAFQKLINFWFIVVGGLLEGANKAFSWVPGIGPKLSEASKAFIKFRDDTNASLNGIQNDIQLNINTEKAKIALEELHREFIDKGWTVTAEARASLVYVGNGQFAPSGGGTGGGTGGSLERPVNAAAGSAWGHYPSGGVHRALDFPVPVGTPVKAPMSGQVVQDGWDPGGFGVHVRTRDSDGNFTILGHLSRELVSVGQRIAKGQVIGYSGNTGNSSGPHLHMERRRSLFDPQSAFNFTSALGGLNARGGQIKPLLFDSGGILPTGISVVRNDTGKPEPLARVGGGGRMFSDADLDYLAAAVERGSARGTARGFGGSVLEASYGARY